MSHRGVHVELSHVMRLDFQVNTAPRHWKVSWRARGPGGLAQLVKLRRYVWLPNGAATGSDILQDLRWFRTRTESVGGTCAATQSIHCIALRPSDTAVCAHSVKAGLRDERKAKETVRLTRGLHGSESRAHRSRNLYSAGIANIGRLEAAFSDGQKALA